MARISSRSPDAWSPSTRAGAPGRSSDLRRLLPRGACAYMATCALAGPCWALLGLAGDSRRPAGVSQGGLPASRLADGVRRRCPACLCGLVAWWGCCGDKDGPHAAPAVQASRRTRPPFARDSSWTAKRVRAWAGGALARGCEETVQTIGASGAGASLLGPRRSGRPSEPVAW